LNYRKIGSLEEKSKNRYFFKKKGYKKKKKKKKNQSIWTQGCMEPRTGQSEWMGLFPHLKKRPSAGNFYLHYFRYQICAEEG